MSLLLDTTPLRVSPDFRRLWIGQAVSFVGSMITSTIHVRILVPVFFALMKERALRLWQLTAERTTGRRLKIFAVI